MMSLLDVQENDAASNDQQPLTLQVQQRHYEPSSKRSGPRRTRDRRQRSATFTAVIGLGLASWIMTNAVTYVELGVFLRELPEHYSIYAYSVRPGSRKRTILRPLLLWYCSLLILLLPGQLQRQILALESANVYPILYMLFNARQQLVGQAAVIWWLLSQGVVVAGLMSLFWGQTAQVFGSSHSLAMLVLTHLGGMVSTTSSVVLYPYVASFPPLFTTALATGEGLSGSLAALLGVVQDPGDAMRFSVTAFYLFCGTWRDLVS
ncbi:hypothetical protein BBJ28_00004112 [Nothophytophthora sp. Chile5]|nr:hypothetical protein BBJ28_00004112 [Nothophytophthora sp. Chile5]